MNTLEEKEVKNDIVEKNTAYIFIPCSFEKPDDFKKVTRCFTENGDWEQVHDEILYMLKFVADKFDSSNPEACQCGHYRLMDAGRVNNGIEDVDALYVTEAHKFRGAEVSFGFQIRNVHFYAFTTSICIFAFQIVFENNDPLWISNALYYLKKVSREFICPQNKPEQGITMQVLAQNMLAKVLPEIGVEFFFYANPSTERANVLTYIEVEKKDNYDHELYFLRRCYSEGFLYCVNQQLDEKELYYPSQDIAWGISPEAAVCLACPDYGREKFIHGTFYKNFNAQYLFMYILLLHQKYVLYLFLTRIGRGMYNNLETLENYQKQLFEFETDFVFTCVTEVPQYQNLYDRMVEAFSLKQMFEDVREPVLALRDIRREAAENREKEQEAGMNRSLFLISILAIFSALMDSYQFAEDFIGKYCGVVVATIVQWGCIVFIVGIVLYITGRGAYAWIKKSRAKGK